PVFVAESNLRKVIVQSTSWNHFVFLKPFLSHFQSQNNSNFYIINFWFFFAALPPPALRVLRAL
ncbi:MAG: hypothetical protein AABW85_04460, partial [archaeon]